MEIVREKIGREDDVRYQPPFHGEPSMSLPF
jgi:hypothetical protein